MMHIAIVEAFVSDQEHLIDSILSVYSLRSFIRAFEDLLYKS